MFRSILRFCYLVRKIPDDDPSRSYTYISYLYAYHFYTKEAGLDRSEEEFFRSLGNDRDSGPQ